MKMKYVAGIKAKIHIYSNKKTGNLFDGSYRSVYEGNGLDFENLREYVPGDNIRDIDWKSSSRNGKMLVKRYVAEKKHNVMLVWDCGRKMSGHSSRLENKHKLAVNAGGILGYLAARNGDNVGAVYNKGGMIQYHEMRTGENNMERLLTFYDNEAEAEYESDLEKSLAFLVKNIQRRMIIFVITDERGLFDVTEDTLKKLVNRHNVIFVRISDTEYTGAKGFHLDENRYIPDFFTKNRRLRKKEKEMREKILKENEKKLVYYRVASAVIDKEDELVEKIVALLAKHRHMNS